MMGLARFAFMVVAAALMAGCASVTALQVQIASDGQWPAGRAPGTYAFDRLPSQQDQPEQQMLEDAAHGALIAKGFSAAAPGAKPDVLVQVGARVTRYDTGAWGDPWWYGGWYGYGYPGWYHRPWFGPYGYGYPYWGGYGYYGGGWYYDRQVALMLRDAASGTPLYEARARSDASSNSAETLSAMFRAAMADFPKSGNVPHSVTVPLAP